MVGVWKSIANLNSHLHPLDICMDNLISGIAGNGETIRLWIDHWIGDVPLSKSLPDLFKLEKHKAYTIKDRIIGSQHPSQWVWNWSRPPSSPNELQQLQTLMSLISSFNITSTADKWLWNVDLSGTFTTKSMKNRIQSATFGPNPWTFPWNRLAPLKVNIMGWRLELNRLPTSDQLQRRSIPMDSTTCHMCKNHDETADHLFLHCPFADALWKNILSWCNLAISKPPSRRELFIFQKTLPIGKRMCKLLNLIIMAYCWIIWKLRNESLFSNKNPSLRFATKELKTLSFLWLSTRSSKYKLTWSQWCSFNF